MFDFQVVSNIAARVAARVAPIDARVAPRSAIRVALAIDVFDGLRSQGVMCSELLMANIESDALRLAETSIPPRMIQLPRLIFFHSLTRGV